MAEDPEGPQDDCPNRSPLYETLNRDRYARQALIKEIEETTSRRLIVYFANVGMQGASVNQDDVLPFQDLVLDIDEGEDVDLLIQSPGGDIDNAEKLIYMIRQRAGGFRVIVAERAKSAATMMALAADAIVIVARRLPVTFWTTSRCTLTLLRRCVRPSPFLKGHCPCRRDFPRGKFNVRTDSRCRSLGYAKSSSTQSCIAITPTQQAAWRLRYLTIASRSEAQGCFQTVSPPKTCQVRIGLSQETHSLQRRFIELEQWRSGAVVRIESSRRARTTASSPRSSRRGTERLLSPLLHRSVLDLRRGTKSAPSRH